MSKAQNRNMERKRKQRNVTLQKTNNNIIEDLMESYGDESPVADLKRMMIRMFKELKEELKEIMKKTHNEYQENMD
jgi:hypothetical protein